MNGIRYAGTPDRIGKIDGKKHNVDIKTGVKGKQGSVGGAVSGL